MSKPRVVCVDCSQMDNPPSIPRPIHDARTCCDDSFFTVLPTKAGKLLVACVNCGRKSRAPRCFSHYKAVVRQRKQRAKANRQRNIYGLSEIDYRDLSDHQGGKCPCGRNHKHTDHDHKIARQECDHPEDKACKRCLRGLLCHTCNVAILGRGYSPRMLRDLADYIENPPARSLFTVTDDEEQEYRRDPKEVD